MFISDTHLPQLLPAKAYSDEDWYAREVADVLVPAWHAVAATNQFPNDGSFVSFELLGNPVVLRRDEGVIRAFLNVCPHRSAKVTNESSGCAAILKCGYHGWEFDGQTGQTKRIPDAPSFRPMKKGALGLLKFKVEVCGGIVFVSVGKPSESVAAQLQASGCEAVARTSDTNCIGRTEVSLDVNWKVAVENTLESYHIAEVHPRTFGDAPIEDACSHDLLVDSTAFTGPGDHRWVVRKIEGIILQGMGLKRRGDYRHTHVHPTFTIAATDSFTILWSYLPESAKRTRVIVNWFARQKQGCAMLPNWLMRQWARIQSPFWLKVFAEDRLAVQRVQSGLEAVNQPGCGLISRREERITHFQRWLLNQLGQPAVESFENEERKCHD